MPSPNIDHDLFDCRNCTHADEEKKKRNCWLCPNCKIRMPGKKKATHTDFCHTCGEQDILWNEMKNHICPIPKPDNKEHICKCECHRSPLGVHKNPCCFVCPNCNRKIKVSAKNSHRDKCHTCNRPIPWEEFKGHGCR